MGLLSFTINILAVICLAYFSNINPIIAGVVIAVVSVVNYIHGLFK